ncbi:MAG: MATE family efflux transporter, partial [Paludibacteraceae bacterium]|nr:MATE family efflux transporter [Paludibacteraceae bacterium]
VPELVVKMFTHDAVLVGLTILPTRILSCSMLLVGFQMVTVNFFTSIGMAGKSIFLSLTRQVLYLIPLALLLPHVFTDNPIMGVWWSIPISDAISALTAAIMLIVVRPQLK